MLSLKKISAKELFEKIKIEMPKHNKRLEEEKDYTREQKERLKKIKSWHTS
jgi:hypothetical protein